MSSGLSLIIDSSVWVEYFRGNSKGKVIDTQLDEGKTLLTPAICFAEVLSKMEADNMDVDEAEKAMVSLSLITEVDGQLASAAGRMYNDLRKIKQKISMSDVISIATARRMSAKILTYDSDFYGLDETAIT